MRRSTVAVLAGLLGVSASTAVLNAPVRVLAEAPDKYAWWDFGYQTAVQPFAVTTNPDDLFVEGRQGNTPLTPTSPPPPFPSDVGSKGAAQAIGAISFTIPPGEQVESVTLLFASGSESANCQYDPSSSNPLGSSCINVMACRTAPTFKAEVNGPWQDVPPYDCTVPSIGALSNDTKGVTFTDIGSLAQGNTLSFVIVPGFYDYEDFLKPGPGALTLLSSSSTSFNLSSGFPPSDTTSTLPGGTAAYVPGASAPVSGGPTASSQPPSPTTSAPARSAAPTAPAAAVVSPPGALARWVAGAFLLVLLLALGVRPLLQKPGVRRALGLRLATAAAVTGARPLPGRGVGRFVGPRTGRPHGL